jgi:predicted ATPase
LEPVIRRLIIKRFRSITAEVIDLDNPTFLVGVNGSGKSNVADALAFLADAIYAFPLQDIFDRRGGIATVWNKTPGGIDPDRLGVSAEFGDLEDGAKGGHYGFEISALAESGFEVAREQCVIQTYSGERYWFDRKGTIFRSNVGLQPLVSPTSLALSSIGGDRRFWRVPGTLASMRAYALQPASIRGVYNQDSGKQLWPTGGNSASVLQEIEHRSPDDAFRIGEILGAIVPNIKQVRSLRYGDLVGLEFTQEWGKERSMELESASMSDGTLRALGLLTAIYQNWSPALMVIEEPEANIHPGALGAILDLLRYASTKMQIVVTTQSPELLDAKWIEDRHLRVVSWDEGATRVSRVSEAARLALQQHLMGAGELLRSNALNPELLQEDLEERNVFEMFEDLE